MAKDSFSRILDASYKRAFLRKNKPFISDAGIRKRVEDVTLCLKNRAGVRALLSGLLVKAYDPKIDIRKPYTEIAGESGDDCYSGRHYHKPAGNRHREGRAS